MTFAMTLCNVAFWVLVGLLCSASQAYAEGFANQIKRDWLAITVFVVMCVGIPFTVFACAIYVASELLP